MKSWFCIHLEIPVCFNDHLVCNKANINCYMIHFLARNNKREIEKKILILLTDGPDEPVLSPSAKSVIITEGNKLGPIVCSVECHPNCNFVWTHRRTEDSFSDISSSQSLEIYNITREQSGKYRCRVNHPNDTSRFHRTEVMVTVHCK